jgi:hypothetical protein
MFEAVDSVYCILETSTAALPTGRDIAYALSRWTERIKARQGVCSSGMMHVLCNDASTS